MKLKMVNLNKSRGLSIAVRHENSWLPLKPIIEHYQKKEKKKFAKLFDVCGDMILFLSEGEKIQKETKKLLETFSEKKPKINLSVSKETLLPFQPLSYRDFMLYEKHVIDAGKGYAKRFLPGVSKIASFYESITGKPFPKLRPKKIWYEKPIYYLGNHLNFFPGGTAIPWPSYTNALDYELELGVLITRPLRNASAEEAREAIGGFTILNDFSARDVQLDEMNSGFGPVKAKGFANALSPVVVTPGEIFPVIDNTRVTVTINGELKGEGNTGNMYHSIEKAVAYASLGEQVIPGEFIGSGTIPGCSGMETGTWLAPGDTIELAIDGIGTLTNTIGSPEIN
ncbi:MAG: fumarylacetoacetate hydrolase family protein [bacterium]|nr:fumarylacetoacetate hydrolase family protein [bacterium]